MLGAAHRRYDGTVRNSAGDVVQFLYGEDGMDGVRIESQVSRRLAGCPGCVVAPLCMCRWATGMAAVGLTALVLDHTLLLAMACALAEHRAPALG